MIDNGNEDIYLGRPSNREVISGHDVLADGASLLSASNMGAVVTKIIEKEWKQK